MYNESYLNSQKAYSGFRPITIWNMHIYPYHPIPQSPSRDLLRVFTSMYSRMYFKCIPVIQSLVTMGAL